MGKSLWYQFTTVIFLTENMRQKGMSEDDRRFRVALENMHYGACDTADTDLFNTCISRAAPAGGGGGGGGGESLGSLVGIARAFM
jgi:hypothetical protein